LARIFEALSDFYSNQLGLPESKVTITPIPGGDKGTKATLQKMKEIVWKSLRHAQHSPVIRMASAKAILDAKCKPKDYLCEYDAIHTFVRDKIRWTRDARRHETLQWPARTLAMGIGDCDDKSMLEAAMLLHVGFPGVAFKAIGANPAVPDQYTHVYIIADPSGKEKWIASDPTVDNAKLGWESPLILKSMAVEL
jgi:hypothetical protein